MPPPLRAISRMCHSAAARLLIRLSGDPGRSLISGVLAGNRDMVEQALSLGADPNAVDAPRHCDPSTALMLAARCGNQEATRLLIAAGADIEAGKGGGGTAAMFAALEGQSECLAILLAAGADPDSCSREGNTPAMMAALTDGKACLSLLIAGGANLAIRSSHDIDAEGYARANGHKELADWLISARALDEAAKIGESIAAPACPAPRVARL